MISLPPALVLNFENTFRIGNYTLIWSGLITKHVSLPFSDTVIVLGSGTGVPCSSSRPVSLSTSGNCVLVLLLSWSKRVIFLAFEFGCYSNLCLSWSSHVSSSCRSSKRSSASLNLGIVPLTFTIIGMITHRSRLTSYKRKPLFTVEILSCVAFLPFGYQSFIATGINSR